MYSYDDQFIDSVRVRRRRLAHALLYRDARLKRQWTDRVGTFAAGAVLAALACAACVAVSFVLHLLSSDTSLSRSPLIAPTAPTAPAHSPATQGTTR